MTKTASHPFSFIICAVRWDIFCTLTYRQEPDSIEVAVRHGQVWLGKMRSRMRLAEPEFFWFLRPERGETNGRVHLHALLRVKPDGRSLFVVPRGMICCAHRVWGRGMTRFRNVEDSYDPAAWYLQKETHGADEYETTKTAACSHGIPSVALLTRAAAQKLQGFSAQAYQSP